MKSSFHPLHVPPSASFYQDGFDSIVYLQANLLICFIVELVFGPKL